MTPKSNGWISLWQFCVLFLLLIGLFGVSITPVQAATFTVSTAAELIAAINTANSNGEADTIILTNDISIPNRYLNNTFFGDIGLPLITSNITINGNGFAIERDTSSGNLFRIISINGGTLTINDAIIRWGYPIDGLVVGGGNIIVANNGTLNLNNSIVENGITESFGAGIFNFSGRININNSTIQSNATYTANQRGGGIYNTGTATITNSLILGNVVFTSSGAGIYNTGTMTITNSTLSENLSTQDGGAIYNGGTLTLNNVTITENTSFNSSGGIYNTGTATVNNSIISGNTFGDCVLASVTFTAPANNIFGVSGNTGGCTGGTALAGTVDTLLAPLADNGGPTLTHALVAGSPAINASGAGATTTDQRGVPAVGIRDIGAFEAGATPTYPTVQFASAGATYNENAGTVNITLNVTGAANFASIAEVYVVDIGTGTATSGADYTAFPPTTVTIDCSSGTCPATRTISLSILTDAVLFEPDETVVLRIIGTNGFATTGAQNTFTATIQDATTTTATISATTANATFYPVVNGQFTVDLGAVNTTGTPITVYYSVGGTAIADTDYTTLTGSVSIANGAQTATIDVVPLLAPLTDKTVQVTLTGTSSGSAGVNATPAIVTIIPDNAGITLAPLTLNVTEGGATDSYEIVLNSQPIADVTVTVSFDAAQVDVSPGSVTFTPATWDTPQTLTVTAVDDTLIEGAHSTQLTHASTSDAANYVIPVVGTVTVNITDNDALLELLTNGGFEIEGATNRDALDWNAKFLIQSDRRVCNKYDKAPPKILADTGDCAYRFKSQTPIPGNRTLRQKPDDVLLAQINAGDTLTFNGRASGKNLAGLARIVLKVNYPSGDRDKFILDIPTGTYPYQTLTSALVMTETPNKIVLVIQPRQSTGVFWVDNFSLTVGNIGALPDNAPLTLPDDLIPLPLPEVSQADG